MSDAPDLRVVRGNPSPEELAALVSVLAAVSAAAASGSRARPRSNWADPSRSMRETLPHGVGAWRASALPR